MRLKRLLVGCGFSLMAMMSYAEQLNALTWEDAFPVSAASAQVHFKARYLDGDNTFHTLEVWRHGIDFLHRRTDNVLDLYAMINTSGELQYRMIQNQRKLVADVNRTHLYRLGIHSDYSGLAFILTKPREDFVIHTIPEPSQVKVKDCTWYAIQPKLDHSASVTQTVVCWSKQLALPLFIGKKQPSSSLISPTFQVESFDTSPLLASQKKLPSIPSDYVYLDMDEDHDD